MSYNDLMKVQARETFHDALRQGHHDLPGLSEYMREYLGDGVVNEMLNEFTQELDEAGFTKELI